MASKAFLVLLAFTGVAFAGELPYTSFGHLPVIEQPRLSPDGRFIASILNSEDGPMICVSEFGSRELTPIVRLKYGQDRIDWIRWANNDRLLISVSSPERILSTRFRVSRLYQVSRAGEGMRQIRRKPTRPVPDWVNLISTTSILSLLPDEPDHILMQVWDERDNGLAVFKVDIARNDFKKQFSNAYDVDSWYANDAGEVLLGIENQREEITLWFRPDDKDKWKRLHTRKKFKEETFNPIEISGGTATVVTDYELGREAVWRYDIASGEFRELLFSVDGYDVNAAIVSNDGTKLLGVDYFDHYRVEHYFDEEAARSAAVVAGTFPGYQTFVVSRSQNEQRLIVEAVRDDAPPRFIWLDLESKGGGVWYSTYPHLEGKALAPVEPIEFEARDGMVLNGYLTMPVSGGNSKPPLIVLPHGGPHSRDYRYFDPMVQFFANRGYAVLQVNFRGSSGFGTPYEVAGYRQWGMEMQKDIYDAIDWLAATGRVDVSQKCMVGGSYGGYVALVAAYQKADQFRCVASIAGIADLYEKANLDGLNPSWKPSLTKLIGSPDDAADRERLKENSPINHLSDMKAPLLIVHGTEDTRVPLAQSRAFYRRAKAAGLDIEYLELKDGTHFLDEYHNRLAVFQALHEFLKKHL